MCTAIDPYVVNFPSGTNPTSRITSARIRLNLETGMERDEDGVVLGSTRLSGSQRLHR
jgi:hypothetical protein